MDKSMSNLDREILNGIKKTKNKLHINAIFNSIILSFTLSLIFSTLLSILSIFVPIYNAFYYELILILIALIGFTIYGILKRPSNFQTSKVIDSYGLKERVITSMGNLGIQNEFAEIQKKDALKHLKNFNNKKVVKYKFNKRNLYIISIFTVLFITSQFIPSPKKDEAIINHNLNIAKSEELKKVEKLKNEIAKDSSLNEDSKKKLEEMLNKKSEDIKKSINEDDLKKTVEKNDKKVENFANRELEKMDDYKNLKEKLKDSPLTKEFAESLDKKDVDVNSELEKLQEKLKNASKEDVDKLLSELNDVSSNIKTDEVKGELSESKSEIENSLTETSEISKLSEGMKNSTEDGAKSYGSIKKSVNSSDSQNDNGSLSQGNNSNSGSSQGNQGNNSNGNQSGNSDGQNGGQGNGGQQKGGSGGVGANIFSTGEKKSGTENVYSPSASQELGSNEDLKGEKSETGQSKVEKSNDNPNIKGESVPYEQVFGNYKEKAYESMNNSSIPEGMKDIIKNYFTSLDN